MTIDPRKTVYKTLMVAENADTEVITAVYRTLARRLHPDVNRKPDAAQRMAELNEGYAILRDPKRRAAYDLELSKRRDRRAGDRLIRQPGSVPAGDAGLPVGPPHGSMLEFGRYRGWTLGQLRRHDPHFLEWLMHAPGGRQYRDEIASLLGRSNGHAAPAGRAFSMSAPLRHASGAR